MFSLILLVGAFVCAIIAALNLADAPPNPPRPWRPYWFALAFALYLLSILVSEVPKAHWGA